MALGGTGWSATVTAAAAAVLLGVVAAGAAAREPVPPDPGTTTEGTVTSNGVEYGYLQYVPRSIDADAAPPLVVVVHGCQTTAQQEYELTRYNEVAEHEGFVVVYPEVSEASQQLTGPLAHCWNFFEPTAYQRGNNDVAAIAAVTEQVVGEVDVDPERVYLVGVSAGGLMASASAAAYPDVYAAVALVTTAGYDDVACFGTGVGSPVEEMAQLAFEQMGPRARVVPIMAIGSDGDDAFASTCTEKAVQQGLRTNNLVLSGAQDAPLDLEAASVREEEVPGGLAYTVSTFEDPDGCLVAESWVVHGMPHAWPGGAEYGGYTDTRAPDGAEATWSFLERYHRSNTSLPCAEADQVAAPAPSPSDPDSGPDSGPASDTPRVRGGDLPVLPIALAAAAAVVALVVVARRRS